MAVIKKHKRHRVSADLKLQGALCLRVAVYWLICQVVFAIAVLAFFTLQESNPGSEPLTPWSLITPAMVISGLVLPLVLLDLLMFSNRFAGPILRIRGYLANLAKGEVATAFKLRDKDFFTDICDNLNDVGEQFQASRESQPETVAAPAVENSAEQMPTMTESS